MRHGSKFGQLAVASGAIASERGVRAALDGGARRRPASRLGLAVVVAAAALFALCGCVAQSAKQPQAAYVVDAQGATSPIARSALAGSTAPGRQEILGVYLPLGPNLAIKAGLEWDGTPTVIQVPMAADAQTYAPQAATPQTVVVPRTVLQPETRLVPRTVYERQALVPVPQAATCAPAPAAQAAPLPGCGPPVGPQAAETCPTPGR